MRFFTDTHLGLRRAAHTTLASQVKLGLRLFDQAMRCTDGHDDCAMLGDLFDDYSNNEKVIEQGVEVARKCRFILGGNHDLRNRTDVLSSLQLMDSVGISGCQIVLPLSPEEGYGVWAVPLDNQWSIVAVPHQMSQGEFVAALEYAKTLGGSKTILALHCNYDNDFGHITDDGATLNLERRMADLLLEKFDYIVIGHEHEPKTDFDGRVRILGNTFPLSFGELTDRFYYDFDTVTGQFTPVKVFDIESGCVRMDVADFLVRSTDDSWLSSQTCEFFDLQGVLPATEYPELGRRLAKLWKLAPNLLMCRNGVRMESIAGSEFDGSLIVAAKRSIPEIITGELEGSDIATLFAELLQLEAAETPAA